MFSVHVIFCLFVFSLILDLASGMFVLPQGVRDLLGPALGGIRNCLCDVITDLLCLREGVAWLVKPKAGAHFKNRRTESAGAGCGKPTLVMSLTFTVSQLKKWMSGFFWSALWQTSKRREVKYFSVLMASQRKMDLKA